MERAADERPVALGDTPRCARGAGGDPGARPRWPSFIDWPISATIRPEEDTRGAAFFRVNGEPAATMQAPFPGPTRFAPPGRRARAGRLRPRPPPGIRFQIMSDESVRLGEQLGDLGQRGAIAFGGGLAGARDRAAGARAVIMVLASAVVAVAGPPGSLPARYSGQPPHPRRSGHGGGDLVQDGLMVVDRLRTAPDTPEGRAAAGRKITPAVLGSTLTTAVVLFPFLYLQGDARAAFMPFAAAFRMALGFDRHVGGDDPGDGAGHRDRVVRWPGCGGRICTWSSGCSAGAGPRSRSRRRCSPVWDGASSRRCRGRPGGNWYGERSQVFVRDHIPAGLRSQERRSLDWRSSSGSRSAGRASTGSSPAGSAAGSGREDAGYVHQGPASIGPLPWAHAGGADPAGGVRRRGADLRAAAEGPGSSAGVGGAGGHLSDQVPRLLVHQRRAAGPRSQDPARADSPGPRGRHQRRQLLFSAPSGR